MIMDVVIPGVDPWEDVLRNPCIRHFALHSIPGLPEVHVHGRERAYFDNFYDMLSHDPTRIAPEARRAYAEAYATEGAPTAGFDWYRAFGADAQANAEKSEGVHVTTPLQYPRGEHRSGDINAYVPGCGAGVLRRLHPASTPSVG